MLPCSRGVAARHGDRDFVIVDRASHTYVRGAGLIAIQHHWREADYGALTFGLAYGPEPSACARFRVAGDSKQWGCVTRGLAVSRIFRRGVSAHQCVTAHTCIRSRHGVSTTMSTRQEERWLLPRHQTDYPARDVVSEGKLHARREATFLVLSMLFGVTLTVL
jgi:hypothetical protein